MNILKIKSVHNYKMLRENSFTIPDLKEIAKKFSYKFKEKKKNSMLSELYEHLLKNSCACKIQKLWNRYLENNI